MRNALILALVMQALAFPAAAASLVYVSPLPGSARLRPETSVIARYDRDISPAASTVRTSGSVSGEHSGRTVLSDDRRTVVFRPDRPFVSGERVEVSVSLEQDQAPTTFWFEVMAGPSPEIDAMRQLELPGPVGRATAVADSGGPPPISAIVLDPTAPGKLFIAPFQGLDPNTPSYLLIVDNHGRPLFERKRPSPCTDFKLQPDGRLTWYDQAMSQFVAMDTTTYAIVDSFACDNGYITDLHELLLLPNGHALLLGLDPQYVDMSKIVEGGNPAASVLGMIIQELDAEKNVVFEWRSWDHFAITDATHEDLTAEDIDYVHSNAIEIDADGNLLLSSRHMDEITKIDRTTGATIWRWGGKHNEFEFIDDFGFSHQHAIRRLPNGHYTMFDNGNFHPVHASRAVEYELDQEARTARAVWQYANGTETYGFAMGNVQRLENGNTLVSFGTGKPDVIEVAPDGSKVLEMSLPAGIFSYRVSRATWGPEETQPIAVEAGSYLSEAAPNPFRQSARMSLRLTHPARISVDVFDVAGRRVLSVLKADMQPVGLAEFVVDLSSLPAGTYLCRLSAGAQSQTRKLVLVP